MVYDRTLVKGLDWSERRAWMSRGQWNELEDRNPCSYMINSYTVFELTLHERIHTIVGRKLSVVIAAISEPWSRNAAQDAMEFFIEHRVHLVLACCLREPIASGRGASTLDKLAQAFHRDCQYHLQEIWAPANLVGGKGGGRTDLGCLRIFQLIVCEGVDWPRRVHLNFTVKMWNPLKEEPKPEVAAIWIPGKETRSAAAAAKRRSKHEG